MSESAPEVGPIDWIVIEFPDNRMTGEGIPILLDLVDRGIVRVLDAQFIIKELDGSVTAVSIQDLDQNGALGLSVLQGASSGLLGDEDLAEAAKAVAPGSTAGILVWENTWAAPFAAALLRGGAQLVASGRIPVTDVIAALDALDASEASTAS